MDIKEVFGFTEDQELLAWVSKIARKVTYRGRQPDDITQELVSEGLLALVEAWVLISEAQFATFPSYAYIRVKGAMLDYLRRKKRIENWYDASQVDDVHTEVLKIWNNHSFPQPENTLERKRLRSTLTNLMAELPQANQKVLIDYYVHDRCLHEISITAGKKNRSWGSKMCKAALATLRRRGEVLALEDYCKAA